MAEKAFLLNEEAVDGLLLQDSYFKTSQDKSTGNHFSNHCSHPLKAVHTDSALINLC